MTSPICCQVARDFLTMYPDNSDGMLKWAILAKKVLKLLNGNKDRTLRKMLDAMIPEEEQTLGADQPSGEFSYLNFITLNYVITFVICN
jgi:hypothetical protein